MNAPAIMITGGAKRMGSLIAHHYATKGWAVLIHYNSSAGPAETLRDSLRSSGHSAEIIGCDLSDLQAVSKLMQQATALAPALSVLINNASLFLYDDPATAKPEDLERAFRINAAAPSLLARDFAALGTVADKLVVNILDNKVFAMNADYFSYTMGKVALYGATKALALRYAPHMRVCGVAPGITLPSGKQSEEQFALTHGKNPLGRGSTPTQIISAIDFFIQAPSVTGEIITIDGGETLAPHGRDVAFTGENALTGEEE